MNEAEIIEMIQKTESFGWSQGTRGGSIMLKEIRESRGMSQQDLANKSGINIRMIQAYEQGYRDINGAKLTTLVTLANALNCRIDQIVTDESLIEKFNTYMNKCFATAKRIVN